MASNSTPDLSKHRRKIFFENLSPKTTTDSLKNYLSGFEIQDCLVPVKEGKNQGHGLATFCKESGVNSFMTKRPHKIDNQPVEVYRSVPDQGSLKEKKGSKVLIVFGIKNELINRSDIENYFGGFGKINSIDMNDEENSYHIEFDDYDAVDKALLDIPHTIKKVEIQLKKGDRYSRSSKTKDFNSNYGKNSSIMPKKSSMKQVQIDSHISSVVIPKINYRIFIKNLPLNANAEILSKSFNWPIEKILIDPLNHQSRSIECWLKDIDDLQVAERFVQRWDQQMILESKITCEVEEDRLELCNKFRIGECNKTDDECDWVHIKCIANGKCSNDCPYGHEKGLKTRYIDNGFNETYRIKITGFYHKLTPKNLSRILSFPIKNCYVNQSNDLVGYAVWIKTMKYAQRLITKWHGKIVDNQRLQCQIELNREPLTFKTSSSSRRIPDVEVVENAFRRSRSTSCLRSDNDIKTSRTSSISREHSKSDITILNDQDLNYEGNLFLHGYNLLIKQQQIDAIRKTESEENRRQLLEMQKKIDRDKVAVLSTCKNINEERYNKEMNVLKILKGVKGVVQLIERNDPSDNNNQQSSSRRNFAPPTKVPPGYSLEEFINEIHHGGLSILEAVQLIQNLTKIVENVHSKGVLHQNIEPKNIIIDWDSKQTSIENAQLTLINFSQAQHVKSNSSDRITQSTSECWYKPPQSNAKTFENSSTIDASCICAIFLWLLTNTVSQHVQNLLPHQHDNVIDKLNKKITKAVQYANSMRKQPLEESQLKVYLIDTFNIAFGYPKYQPWTISDLQCRLESIHELLLSRNPKIITTEAIFQDLVSTYNTTTTLSVIEPNVDDDPFTIASIRFQQAKKYFVDDQQSSYSHYSWSNKKCTWLDTTQISINERRHDDILTYYFRDGHMSSSCSVIIACFATLTDEKNCLMLSIGSPVNGKTSRIPIGHYDMTYNIVPEFRKDFSIALNNLIISVTKERRMT